MAKTFKSIATSYKVTYRFFDSKTFTISNEMEIESDSKNERIYKTLIAKKHNVKTTDVQIVNVETISGGKAYKIHATAHEIVLACIAAGIKVDTIDLADDASDDANDDENDDASDDESADEQ